MCAINFNQPFTYSQDFENFRVQVEYAVVIQSKLGTEPPFVIQGCDAECVIDVKNKDNVVTGFKLLIKTCEKFIVNLSAKSTSEGLVKEKSSSKADHKCKDDTLIDDGNRYKVIEVNPQFYSKPENVETYCCKLPEIDDGTLLKTPKRKQSESTGKYISHRASRFDKFSEQIIAENPLKRNEILFDDVNIKPTNIVECKYCNESVQLGRELQEHTNKPGNIYLCSNCNTSFQTKCQLNQHKSFCIICKYCKKHFMSTVEFDKHNTENYQKEIEVNSCKKVCTDMKNYNLDHKLINTKEQHANVLIYKQLNIEDNIQTNFGDVRTVDQVENCVGEVNGYKKRYTDVEYYGQHNLEGEFGNCEHEVTENYSQGLQKQFEICDAEVNSCKRLEIASLHDLEKEGFQDQGEVNGCRKWCTDSQNCNKHNTEGQCNHFQATSTTTTKCSLCSCEFNTKCLLELHKNLRHFQHKVCDYCKTAYEEKNAEFHSKSDLLTCGTCGAVYLTNCLLRLHSFYCHKCDKCKKLFKNIINYEKHGICTESNPDSEINVRSSTPETEAVPFRSYKYAKHLPCEICNKTFDNRAKLRLHIKNHLTDKQLMCAECGKTFKLPNQLKVHLTTHSTARAYRCGLCGKSFKTKSTQIMHTKSHAGIKPFRCNICDGTFTTKSALKLHLQLHSSDKPFACNVCSKRFYRKHHLALHLQLHTGKPFVASAGEFQCETCGKSFQTKTTLSVHVRVHTGEKPYACAECGKRFSQRSGLCYHKRTHGGDKPFKCETCSKSFGLKWRLVEHERVHTGEKPFKCEVCDLRFSVRSNFCRHSKLHNE